MGGSVQRQVLGELEGRNERAQDLPLDRGEIGGGQGQIHGAKARSAHNGALLALEDGEIELPDWADKGGSKNKTRKIANVLKQRTLWNIICLV